MPPAGNRELRPRVEAPLFDKALHEIMRGFLCLPSNPEFPTESGISKNYLKGFTLVANHIVSDSCFDIFMAQEQLSISKLSSICRFLIARSQNLSFKSCVSSA